MFSPEDFTENSRIYDDRFELTFRQAKAVQKIMRYLAADYDPGGPENTPENITKRTFYYDTYLGRPIPKDHPEQTLTAKPEHDQDIRDYVQSKNRSPEKG